MAFRSVGGSVSAAVEELPEAPDESEPPSEDIAMTDAPAATINTRMPATSQIHGRLPAEVGPGVTGPLGVEARWSGATGGGGGRDGRSLMARGRARATVCGGYASPALHLCAVGRASTKPSVVQAVNP